ncbi:hypothetical protein [uncultured Ruegeria sp.]|uniref:hypothetical protein n=1 Tax=uncultured Ruegeria sp. TaxID=259304 RepID=UPI00262DCEED|nr:hypothetical protein [uncultured Ruegeria sp.]
MRKKFCVLFLLGALPGHGLADMKGGPCQNWNQSEADPYCASFLDWLPQYRADFEIIEVEGRYSTNCSVADGVEISGLGDNEQFELTYQGQRIADADTAYTYYGKQNPPVTFVIGILSNELPHYFTVNADQGGFYLLEDIENGRRLSRCAE